MNYDQFIKDLCIRTAKILINLPSEPNGKDVNPLQLNSKLIFPNYEQDDKKPRISEQEARFVFCQAFEQMNHGLYYSVETPTEYNYSFKMSKKKDVEDIDDSISDLKVYLKNPKKKEGQSAQSDMSIFTLEDSGFKQNINVEFKAHNAELSHIAKDFLKLLAESQHGLFFHLVENIDSGTLESIINKYNTSIKNTFKQIKTFNNDNRKNKIKCNNFIYYFAICILNRKPSLLFAKIKKENPFKEREDNFGAFAKSEYKDLNSNKESIHNWSILYF